MNKMIFDSSAVMALVNGEKGSDIVEKNLPGSIMSVINVAEIVSNLSLINIPENEINSIIHSLISKIEGFDYTDACQTGLLRKKTKKHGLSLGDRACISLASKLKLPVLTADKAWAKLDLGIEVMLIR